MFKIRPFEARTLAWWNDERENIDMNPPYQRRGGVWKAKQKAYLIDSILNGFDLPKIYIADFTYTNTSLNLSRKPYAVIDGRQRLESIFEFFDGTLPLAKDFLLEDQPDVDLGGFTYKELKMQYPKIASKFENFNITTMSVISDEAARINDLFVRLNSSKPLTGAEIRNAMPGPGSEIVRRLSSHRLLTACVSFKTARAQDRNVAAKLLLIEFLGDFADTKKAQLDKLIHKPERLAARAEANPTELERAEERVVDNMNRMVHAFSEKDPLLSSEGPVVVYYWFFRHYSSVDGKILRAFLAEFQGQRDENKEQVRQGNSADEELSKYETLSRNTNDQSSLRERFKILVRRFELYRKERRLLSV
ncbi:DUF262 domain-containing protein [Archangium lansingense]|uniref:DUF262 domain-containing protein n=1 Tax=Archangium lansingense TaxID=2995310 RepID=A0ABT4A150_9BACT|nr:DUF262 domain-containing protein [Archangium lansinium]MCY1075096.1 DUF262 domain-containing protein [Archangium lansinium]